MSIKMHHTEIKQLLAQFESTISAAWTYDTKLWYVDDPSSKQLQKSDQLFKDSDEVREKLLSALKELSDG